MADCSPLPLSFYCASCVGFFHKESFGEDPASPTGLSLALPSLRNALNFSFFFVCVFSFVSFSRRRFALQTISSFGPARTPPRSRCSLLFHLFSFFAGPCAPPSWLMNYLQFPIRLGRLVPLELNLSGLLSRCPWSPFFFHVWCSEVWIFYTFLVNYDFSFGSFPHHPVLTSSLSFPV